MAVDESHKRRGKKRKKKKRRRRKKEEEGEKSYIEISHTNMEVVLGTFNR